MGGRPVLPWPRWEDPIIRGVAAAAMSMVSLGFAAFTFLYGSLLKLEGGDGDPRIKSLRTKLRRALYGTAFAVLLAACLAILAFTAIGSENAVLSFVAIGLAFVVLLVLSTVTLYLVWDVYSEGKNPNVS